MIQALAARFAPKSPRERLAMRVGAVALAVWLLAGVALRPYWNGLAQPREQLDRERGLLRREATLLAEAGAFATRYAAIERATLDQAPRLFPGSDLLAASASLAGYVGRHAAGHRVMVQQSESRPAEDGGSGTVGLRVDIKAVSDLRGIAELLYALEHGPKLVRVEQLLITPVSSPRSAADAEEVLALVASVKAYAFADSAGQTSQGARR